MGLKEIIKICYPFWVLFTAITYIGASIMEGMVFNVLKWGGAIPLELYGLIWTIVMLFGPSVLIAFKKNDKSNR